MDRFNQCFFEEIVSDKLLTAGEYRKKYRLNVEQAIELRRQLGLFRNERQTEAYLKRMLATKGEKLTVAWIVSEFGICETFAEWLQDLYFAITERSERNIRSENDLP